MNTKPQLSTPFPTKNFNRIHWNHLVGWLFTALFAVFIPLGNAQAESCVEYASEADLIGSLGISGVVDLVVQDTVGYALDSAGLIILDLSLPTDPQQVGSLAIPGHGSQLAVAGSHVFVLVPTGMQSVNATDPTNPVMGNVAPFAGGMGLAAADGMACITYDGGVALFDLTNPSSPTPAGTWSGPDTFLGAACTGDLVFACGTNSLYAIDASDLMAPGTLGHIGLEVVSQEPELIGNRLLLPGFGSLTIVDVSDPATLWPRTTLDTLNGQVTGVAVGGDLLMVADASAGTRVFALDGISPSPLTDISIETSLLASGPDAALAIATLASDEMGVIDLSGILPESLIGTFAMNGDVEEIILAGANVHVRQGTLLTRLDLTDEDHPTGGESGDLGSQIALSRNGMYAYVNAAGGLDIFDISALTSPVLVGHLALDRYPGPITAAEDIVYLTRAEMDNITVAIDVSTPSSPVQLGMTGAGSEHNFRKVHGSTIFEGRRSGLSTFDVSDPGVLVPGISTGPENAQDVAFADDRAYAVGSGSLGPDQVCILDISDPTAPVTIDCFEPGGHSVAVVGHRLYIGTDAGLNVYDITDPDLPVFLGGLETGSAPDDMAVVGDRLFLTAGTAGLSVAPRQCDEILEPLPFHEDFDDGIADGFFIESGDWQVQDGTYFCQNSELGKKKVATAGDFAWKDLHLGVDTRTEGSPVHEIAVRYNPGGDTYLVTIRRAPWNDAFLHKVVGGVQTQLAHTANLDFGPGPWHHIQVDAIGSRITAAIDGQTAITFDDAVAPIRQGRVAFASLALGEIDWQDVWFDNLVVSEANLSGVPLPSSEPAGAQLLAPYPNPFNPQVEISFALAQRSPVALAIYDIGGRHVTDLVRGTYDAGQHVVSWDGRDKARRNLPSGVYFVKLIAEGVVDVRRVALVR
nr:FlgD immunoglobulin-like domain containing protein [Candidatus Krumholzibacteria bacterium]